jgi:fluoroacetyl-CoA thioesterase
VALNGGGFFEPQPKENVVTQIESGLVGESELMVGENHTASHLGSGGVDVLATPVMIALMEDAARSSVDSKLDQGQITVGVNLNVSHLAATPVGMRVSARAELVAVDGRRLTFKVEARDEWERIGEGTHIRAIINLDRFMARLQPKVKPKIWLTLTAAADLLKISPEILRRHARNGVIPATQKGGSWRFSKSELESWLSSGGPQVGIDLDTSPWGK